MSASMGASNSEGLLSVPCSIAPQKAGEGIPRRHPLVGDGELVSSFDPSLKTVYDNFCYAANKFPSRPYLGQRPVVNESVGSFAWQTYGEVAELVKQLGAGLRKFKLGEQANVGLYSVNRPEWVVAELACYYNK